MADQNGNKIPVIERPSRLKTGLKIAALILAGIASTLGGLQASGIIKLPAEVTSIIKVITELSKEAPPTPAE